MCEKLVAPRRLSLRRALRADFRHAARKPSDASAGLHACDPQAAVSHARGQRPERSGDQGGLRPNAAPAPRSPPTRGGWRMIFKPFTPFAALRIPRQIRRLPLGAGGRVYAAPSGVLRRAGIVRGRRPRRDDEYAIPIVALSMLGVAADEVVGTVRIHEDAPGLWWGSRLAVERDCRRVGALGATLIRLAVSSARAMGATTFLATCAGAERAALPPDALGDARRGRLARPAALHDAGRSHDYIRRATRRSLASWRCRKAA